LQHCFGREGACVLPFFVHDSICSDTTVDAPCIFAPGTSALITLKKLSWLTFKPITAGMPRMKRIVTLTLYTSTILSTLFLAGCQGANMPQMFWSNDNRPDYARGNGAHAQGQSRVPLNVPPELRKDIEVPMPDQVAVDVAKGDRATKSAVAGKAVALNTRTYAKSPAQIFSATIDAMTALNMPVQSVDSPSGVITSDWIRPNANSQNMYVGVITSMIGAGPVHLRYRFIVRVFRLKNGKSELQIRTLGQQFISGHWVNKPIKKKVYLELFSAVEERLSGLKKIDKSKQTPSSTTAPATIQ